jgi:mercuric ion transport protein
MWKRTLTVLPGIGVSLLPKLACPMCWPAYAGLLSSLGLGFLVSTTYLLPVTTAFLLVAVAALGFRARARRGYGPMLLGLVAGAAVLYGKFFLESDAAMYCGVALLVAASVWNSWPLRAVSCPDCVPAGCDFIQLNENEKRQ